jgi:hypothetical protein
MSDARPTQTLQDFPPGHIPSPSPDYAANYDQFGGAGSWHNMNATPDFPSAARAALANYAEGQGEQLDGVIAADPFALQAMLSVTGPVDVPLVGTLRAGNVVDVTTNRAYSSIPGSATRKDVLGAAAIRTLDRFLSMHGQGLPRLEALGRSVATGHLRVFTTDDRMQEGLALLKVDGALRPTDGDVFAVTVNNGSGSKIDYYASRSIDYEVRLGGNHEAISTATITLANDAPIDGQPRYVIGPFRDDASAGDQIPILTTSCPATCELVSASRDGDDVTVATGSENGLRSFQDYRTIGAGRTGSLTLKWHADDVWEGNSAAGWYRLTYFGQTTIRPTRLRIVIHVPDGTRIVWTSEPMMVDGSTATWEGTPNGTMRLALRFEAPLPLRLWRSLGVAVVRSAG